MPLKNSANNFDESCRNTFLFFLESFFVIGFRLVILILEICLLLKSIFQLFINSSFEGQNRDQEVLYSLIYKAFLSDSHRIDEYRL